MAAGSDPTIALKVSTGSGEGYTIRVAARNEGGRQLVDLESMARALRLSSRATPGRLAVEEALSAPGSVCSITADNPFVHVVHRDVARPERLLQLHATPVTAGGKLWLPAPQAARLFALWLDRDVAFVPSSGVIEARLAFRPRGVAARPAGELVAAAPSPASPAGPARITGVEVDAKANGAVVTFRATGAPVKAVMIDPDPAGNPRLAITGAEADMAALTKSYPDGVVRAITPAKLADGSIRLTLTLDRTANIIRSVDYQPDRRANSHQLFIRSDADVEALRTKEKERRIASVLERDLDRWRLNTIVLDAGHGGKDPGAVGLGGTREKDVVLNITRDLGKLISRKWPEVKVVYTRSDDRFIPLHERGKIANRNGGKLFLSIHCNASENRRVRGAEVYILGPHKTDAALKVAMLENAVIKEEVDYQEQYKGFTDEHLIMSSMAQNAFIRQSSVLAQEVLRPITSKIGTANRGVRQAGFMVLWTPSMPSALVEVGYISNRQEERILRDRQEQTKIAYGIFQGLEAYRRSYEASRMAAARR